MRLGTGKGKVCRAHEECRKGAHLPSLSLEPLGAVASLSALGSWAPTAERGPSLESIYRVSLTVDFCEDNKIISFKNLFHHSQLGAPHKEKNQGLGHVPSADWLRRPCLGG